MKQIRKRHGAAFKAWRPECRRAGERIRGCPNQIYAWKKPLPDGVAGVLEGGRRDRSRYRNRLRRRPQLSHDRGPPQSVGSRAKLWPIEPTTPIADHSYGCAKPSLDGYARSRRTRTAVVASHLTTARSRSQKCPFHHRTSEAVSLNVLTTADGPMNRARQARRRK
jgi:hypothetical protein